MAEKKKTVIPKGIAPTAYYLGKWMFGVEKRLKALEQVLNTEDE